MTNDAKPDRLPLRVLTVNTAAFALCFAGWVIFGPSARLIAEQLHISPGDAALLKSLPILLGSLLRIPVGILTDEWGARRVFSCLMILGAAAIYGLTFATEWQHLLAGALAFGVIGTTFAVGVQSVSSWTPRPIQGLALGIFGAGNVGTALTTLGMPILLLSLGWQGTFQVYAAVLVLAAAGYWLLMRDAPEAGPLRTFAARVSGASGFTTRPPSACS
jgi:NNP family nitrate/nitrite transporter-like MFS transporter